MCSNGEHKGLEEHVNTNVATQEPPAVECRISGILDSGSKCTGHTDIEGRECKGHRPGF